MEDQNKEKKELVGEFIQIEVYGLDQTGRYDNEKPETSTTNIRPESIRELRAFKKYSEKTGIIQIDESEFTLDTGEFRRSPEKADLLKARIEAILKAQRDQDHESYVENYLSKISQTINNAAEVIKPLESEKVDEKSNDKG